MLMQALMGGAPQAPGQQGLPGMDSNPFAALLGNGAPGMDSNPLAALLGNGAPGMDSNPLAALLGNGAPEMKGAFGPQNPMGQPPAAPLPKTRFQKFLPLLQLIGIWVLLAYFAFWREPTIKAELGHSVLTLPRWGHLLSTNIISYDVEIVAMVCTLPLHSFIRILTVTTAICTGLLHSHHRISFLPPIHWRGKCLRLIRAYSS
jgi:hypothetical protein